MTWAVQLLEIQAFWRLSACQAPHLTTWGVLRVTWQNLKQPACAGQHWWILTTKFPVRPDMFSSCFRHFSSFHHSYASHAVSAELPRPQSRPSFESDVWGSYRHLGNCIFCSFVPPLKVLSVLQGDISPRWATHVHVHLPTDHHNEACTDADSEIQRFGDASRWSLGTSEHVDTLEVP